MFFQWVAIPANATCYGGFRMTDILIVDGDRPVRATIGQILNNRGYGCTLAANGSEARRYLREQAFELIVSDIVLPQESGIEFVRQALAEYKSTAVIVVTGIDDPQVADTMLREGAYDYILKPVQEVAVQVGVANALRRRDLEVSRNAALKEMEHRALERITFMQQTIHHLEQSQKAFKESENRYRELVEGANSVILRIDPSGKITFINAFGISFFGYDESEILGKNVIGTIIPISGDARDAALKNMIIDVLKHPDRYHVNENENIRKSGERVWVAWTNKAVYDEEGRLIEILTIGNDITQRKKTEEKIHLLSSVLEKTDEGILITDTHGVIHYVNHAFERMSGYRADEVIGKNPRILKSGVHGPDFYQKMWRTLTEGHVWENRFVNKRKDNRPYQVKTTVSPVKNAAGCITHYVGVQQMIS